MNDYVYLVYTERVDSNGYIDEWVHSVCRDYDTAVEFIEKDLGATRMKYRPDRWEDKTWCGLRYKICEEVVL